MTTGPGEVAGLPEGGPATLPRVKHYLRIPEADQTEDADVTEVVEAVNAWVRTRPTAARSAEQAAWWAPTVRGAVMLAGRFYRRRDSIAGVLPLGADAAVYISRSDPDVAQLLELGAYAKPAVG